MFTTSTFNQSFHASEHNINIICLQEHKNTHDEFGGVSRTHSNISNEAFLLKAANYFCKKAPPWDVRLGFKYASGLNAKRSH